MELKDFISSKNIALYMKEIPAESSIDKALFPETKQLGTELEFAKGAKKKAVALRMSQFDVAAKVRALNATLDISKKELPFFKEAMGINETKRRDLINALKSNNENLVQAIASQVFENYANLIEGANIQAKRMRCSLIQKGEINFTAKDGDIVADYGVPANHKQVLSGAAMWTNADADIVGDIERWKKVLVDDHYATPTILLMTEKAFANTILINNKITAHLKGGESTKNMILSKSDYVDFVDNRLGLKIVFLENTTYIPEEGAAAVPYYEDKYVSLISGTTLGTTVYGTTPEEYDKVYGSTKLDTSMVGVGIAVTTMVKEDPVSVDTKVSQLVLPSFERADEIFFATISA